MAIHSFRAVSRESGTSVCAVANVPEGFARDFRLGMLTLFALIVVLLTSQFAIAQNRFFDSAISGTTWDNSTTANWGTVTGGPYTSIFGANNSGQFEGTGATINVDPAGVTADGLYFTANGYVLQGGTITKGSPAGGAIFNVATGVTGTINSNIASTTLGINKLGAGTLALGGNVTYNGTGNAQGNWLKINAGTLRVTGGTHSSNASFVMAEGGDAGAQTFEQTGGTFTQTATIYLGNGAGQGASTFTISGGTFNAAGQAVEFAEREAATINISGTADVTLGAVVANRQSGTASRAATINLDGGSLAAASFANTGSNSSTFTFNFNGGTLKSTGTSTLLANTLTRANVRDGGAIFDIGAGHVATIAEELQHSNIGGDAAIDGGLIKNGAGTLTLTAANTYTGNNIVNNGILRATGPTTLPGSVLINSNGTLQLVVNNNTWNNTITGAGKLQIEFVNGGVANTLVPNVTGITGIIELTKSVATTGDKWQANNINAPNAEVIVNTGTQLFVVNNTTFESVSIIGTGNTETRGAIRLIGTLNAPVILLGNAQIGPEGGTLNGAITSGAAGTQMLTLGGTSGQSTGTYTGAIGGGTGTIALTNAGATNTLTGNNTYTGITTISAGTLQIGNGGTSGTLGNGGNVVNSGALILNRSDALTVNNNISGSGTLTKTGGGVTTLGGTNSYTGLTTVNAGTLQLGSSTALNNTSALTMSGSAILNLNGFNGAVTTTTTANTNTITNSSGTASTLALGTINGTLANLFTGNLALTLSNNNQAFALSNGSNTFSGGITLLHNTGNGTRMSPGTIVAGAYGTGPITIGQVATDKAGIYFATANQTLTNPIVFNTELGSDRPGVRSDVANITLSGQITANNSNALFSTNGTGSFNLTGRITGTRGLTLDNAFGSTVTVTLNNAAENNDYAGTTTIEATKGVLVLGRNNQIPNGVGKGNVQLDGTLNLNGFSDTINGLAGAGILDGVSGTPNFTIGDGNATGSNFSGIIRNTAGSLTITKTGGGDQTFSGNNTYSGGTFINGGRLVVSSTGNFGTGFVTVANGAEAFIQGGTHNNTFNLTGDGGTGSTIDTELRGAIRMDGGTIGAAGSVVLQANSSIGSYNNNTGTINAVISETGGARALSINKSAANGPGTIVLGAANTFSGDTRIYNGTLSLNNVLALQNSTVDMNGADAGAISFGTLTSATFGGLKGSRNLNLQNTTPAAVALTAGGNNQTTTYSGQLTGTGSFNKTGTGTQTFTGANTYSGTTTVSGGTLELGAGGSIANTASVSVGFTGTGGSDTLTLSNPGTHRLGVGDLLVGVSEVGSVNHNAGIVTVGDSDATLENVRIGAGAAGVSSYTIGAATLNVGDNGTGNVNLGRGNLSVGHTSAGSLTVNNGAVINTGDLLVGSGATSGTVTQNGGTINVWNDNTYTLNAGDPGATAIVNQSGGTTNVVGGMVLGNGVGPATQNQYNLSGGTLDFGDTSNVNQTLTGTPSTLTVNADGQFNLSGTGILSDVSVIDVSTSATGEFLQTGGTLVVGSDGVSDTSTAVRAITDINGDFTQSAGTLKIDIFGADGVYDGGEVGNFPVAIQTDSDVLSVSGDIFLDGTLAINTNGVQPPSFGWYDVAYANTITLGNNFNVSGLGLYQVIDNPLGSGQILQVAAPEPAALVMWGLVGAVGLFACLRRMKKSR